MLVSFYPAFLTEQLLTGQVITISLPVYREDQLLGWVATDSSVAELFDDPVLFRSNEFTYAFVVNNHGLWKNICFIS